MILMQNFYNGIDQNIQGLLDTVAGGALMQRTLKDSKSIVECIATGSFICIKVKVRVRDQLDRTVNDNID